MYFKHFNICCFIDVVYTTLDRLRALFIFNICRFLYLFQRNCTAPNPFLQDPKYALCTRAVVITWCVHNDAVWSRPRSRGL